MELKILREPLLARSRTDESGQAITEYLLMLAIIGILFMTVVRGLGDRRLMESITRPITQEFARVYQYGHPKAKGFEDGGPEYHPRARGGRNSFRIFINSRQR
jgi:hypothetical protein